MACHEIAALRLGLMRVLGRHDEAERQHEIAELGDGAEMPADARLLDLAVVGDEPLGFRGGQYIIVDSGLVLPSGKAAKRAYSILSADAEQTRFQLAVKRIPGGLASGFLHGAAIGAEIK